MKLSIAIPCYGSMMSYHTTKGLLQLQRMGIDADIQFLGNESLVTRARNRLTHRFLKSDATHLMFIDADIGFEAKDILKLVETDKPIIAGAYPKKEINWHSIKETIKKNPNVSDQELKFASGNYVFNPMGDNFTLDEPVEVDGIGTGFMLIQRNVFTKLKETGLVTISYCPYEKCQTLQYWICGSDCKGIELSEDYYFSHQCRKIGISTYLLPSIVLKHIGTYTFEGSIPWMLTQEQM